MAQNREIDSVEIKKKLQNKFPKFKFSVTRNTFAGGHSVNIRILEGNIKGYNQDDNYYDLTDEMKDFVKQVNDIANEVGGGYNNSHGYGSQWLGVSVGSYSKPYVYKVSLPSGRGGFKSIPSNRKSSFDYGEEIGNGHGWRLYGVYLQNRNTYVYNLVKDKDTKPNRDKWDEIRGLIYTQEAFKWTPKTQTFQRWGKINDIEKVASNLFRILGQYYKQEGEEQTPMPTHQEEPQQNQESLLKVGDKFRYVGGSNDEIVYEVQTIDNEGKIYLKWNLEGVLTENWYWTPFEQANELLKDGRIVKVQEEAKPTPSGIMREITDEEAKDFASAMMFSNEGATGNLNIRYNDIDVIYTNQDLQDKYVEKMKTSLNNRLKTKYAFIMTDILNKSLSKVYKILEDKNEHLLNNFLALSGFYGDTYQREYTNEYNTNPTLNLKPFENEGDSQHQTPTPSRDEIAIKVGSIFVFKNNRNIQIVESRTPDVIKTIFYDVDSGRKTEIAFNKSYWLQKIGIGEVSLITKLKDGDIFQYNNSDTYYKITNYDEKEKNYSYDILDGKGEVLDSIVMFDKNLFDLLTNNPFTWVYEVPFYKTQETKKEKLEKAIVGLEILAKRGNEKAQKAVLGLKILLKNLNK